jgi:hypothetical protein
MASSDTYDGHKELANQHPSGPDEEESPAPDSINKLNTEDRHDSIDNIANNSVVRKRIVSDVKRAAAQGKIT